MLCCPQFNMQADAQERTLYICNLDSRVTEKLLEELFTQVGPVTHVSLNAAKKFAFIEFEDEASVLFACDMIDAVELFGQKLKVQPRDKTQQKLIYEQMGKARESFERHSGSNSNGNGQPVPRSRRSDVQPYGNQPVPIQHFDANNGMSRRHMYKSEPFLAQQQQDVPPINWQNPFNTPPPPVPPQFYQSRSDQVVARVQHDGRYRGQPVRKINNEETHANRQHSGQTPYSSRPPPHNQNQRQQGNRRSWEQQGDHHQQKYHHQGGRGSRS